MVVTPVGAGHCAGCKHDIKRAAGIKEWSMCVWVQATINWEILMRWHYAVQKRARGRGIFWHFAKSNRGGPRAGVFTMSRALIYCILYITMHVIAVVVSGH